ncbi:Zinc finger, RING-type [Corchorus capsularis]|uniref:Zinc finger, RING-type n=1 Tax=Corchorus capsularis TaxID=210143 RepID=A0A1R3GDK0_COCAP|nr:Zinc finger, RING-type [Corchorus capsularis]
MPSFSLRVLRAGNIGYTDNTDFFLAASIALTLGNAFLLFSLICRHKLREKLGLQRPIETPARIPTGKVVVEVVVPPQQQPPQAQEEAAANILSGSFAVYGATRCKWCGVSMNENNCRVVFQCKHEYHRLCIESQIEKYNSDCPLCLAATQPPDPSSILPCFLTLHWLYYSQPSSSSSSRSPVN